MNEEPPDIVDRALARLLSTSGPQVVPAELMDRVRHALEGFEVERRVHRNVRLTLREQVAWAPLAACMMVIVVGSWVAALHGALFSTVAGQRVLRDGTVWVHYTDGRVVSHTVS
jgi:hypothetical protein